MKKKICILSMQNVDNMGSVLQAYGLKKIVESFGCSVEFLSIRKIQDEYELYHDRRIFEEEGDTKYFIQKISRIDKYLLNRIKNKILLARQRSLYKEFRLLYLDINKTSDFYDLCIIGSDEVFNCLNSGEWGFTSQLFGNVPEAKQIITYAACCGSTTYEKLPENVKHKIAKSFEEIDAFSVRDKNTYNFVKKMTKKEIIYSLDPVIIYDFSSEVSMTLNPVNIEHYCLIYSYTNRIHEISEIKEVKNFCKNKGLTPVTVGLPQFWCKKHITCTPFEFLKAFQCADFVITDTFHGTIISVKYAKKFAVLTRKSNFNKLSDLIKRLDIEKHLVDNISQLELAYSLDKDCESIEKVIETERSNTYKYLERYIDGE